MGLCTVLLSSAFTFVVGVKLGRRTFIPDLNQNSGLKELAYITKPKSKKNLIDTTTESLDFYEKLKEGDSTTNKGMDTLQNKNEGLNKNDSTLKMRTGSQKTTGKYPISQKKSENRNGEILSASKFYIQVASFRNIKAAAQLSEKLNREGYPAYTKTEPTAGKTTWYVVWIGPFDGATKVESVLTKVKKHEKTAYIVKKNEAIP